MKSEFLSLQFHLAKIIVDDVALCSIVLQKKAFSFSSSFLLLGQECCRVNSQSEGKVKKIKIELETERRGWKREMPKFLAKNVPSIFTFTFNVIQIQ